MVMHPLLRFALLFCPGDYRRRYARSIAVDAQTRGIDIFSASLDLIFQGVSMHLENFGRDLSFAARTLARSPVYAAVAILAIALAIAANVAIVSVLEGVLLRPLPYPNADRIMYVSENATDPQGDFSYLDARDLSAGATTLQAFGISDSDQSATLSGIARPVLVEGNDVDDGYLRVLGAKAELGRVFSHADLGSHAVLISDRVWRAYYGARTDILGRTAELDGLAYKIVGVMPPKFRDVSRAGLIERDFWTPTDPRSNANIQRGYQHYSGWALLRPGISFDAAQADVNRVMSRLVRQYAKYHLSGWGSARLGPALQVIVSPVRTMLWLLYGAVGLLLIIACANVTNLALVRAATREGELNVRSALGASRSRLITQLCVEMSLIAAIGGIAGVVLGWLALRAFTTLASQIIPRWESVHVDGTVIAYVGAVLAVTTIVTGLIPALSSQRDLAPGMKGAGRGGVAAPSKQLRSALVVAEVALAIAVVVSAGLIVRSFVALTHVPIGFDGTNLYVVDVPGFPKARYPNYDATLRGAQRIQKQIAAIPGVSSVAITTAVPFDWGFSLGTEVPGHPKQEDIDGDTTGPGYFRTVGVPLLRGRDFDDRDRYQSQQVAIVSAAFARHFYGSIDAVGKVYHPGISSGQHQEHRTIVGVAGDTRNSFEAPFAPAQYFPVTQIHAIGRFVVRTNGRNAGFVSAIDRAYTTVDPQFAPPKIRSYTEILAEDSGKARAAALLFVSFALIALLLSLAGVYAVTAYSVAQRTREFGIRKAIGATNGAVLGQVVMGALRQCAFGIAIGVVIAAVGSRLLAAMLFQTSPLDPLTYVLVVSLLVACTVAAALVPALRATRVAPAHALRYE